MINAILVDDEAIVRLMLTSIVDWQSLGVQIVGTYANGKQVLTHLEQDRDVQLIITDINMPILSGLELIGELQTKEMAMAYLVVSAYDDYDLVREAFKLGITDYILKQNISEESLTALIMTIVDRIDKPIRDTEDDLKARLEEEVFSMVFAEENYTPSIFGHQVEVGHFALALISIEDYKEVIRHYGMDIQKAFIWPLKQTVKQTEAGAYEFYLINRDQDEYVLFMVSQDQALGKYQDIKAVCSRISAQLSTFMNIASTITFSQSSLDLGESRQLYLEAKNLNRYKHIFGQNRVIHPDQVKGIQSVWYEKKQSTIAPMLKACLKGDRVGVRDLLMTLVLVEGNEVSLLESTNTALAIICEVGLYLESIHEDMVNVFGKHVDYAQRFKGLSEIDELQRFMFNWLGWFMDYIANRSGRTEANISLKAKAYIEQNYMNEKLTLKEVSDSLGFSEKHFSSLFSKESGVTYSEYLTSVRLDKAKELMIRTGKKVYEIGMEVGYKNTEHFSRVFKKYTGFSPNEYRNRGV